MRDISSISVAEKRIISAFVEHIITAGTNLPVIETTPPLIVAGIEFVRNSPDQVVKAKHRGHDSLRLNESNREKINLLNAKLMYMGYPDLVVICDQLSRECDKRGLTIPDWFSDTVKSWN